MPYLILGLVIFLGVHSIRIVAEDWRTQTIARLGGQRYKALYSTVSLVGFVLIIWGFGVARDTPVQVWLPPVPMRHVAALLNLIAFIFVAAAYVPGNAIKARVHHPMVLGVKTWALAHLLANGTLAHMVLFGAFLAWGVLDFIASRRRDRVQNIHYPAGTTNATLVTVVVGTIAAGLFAVWLHGLLIGVKPFG